MGGRGEINGVKGKDVQTNYKDVPHYVAPGNNNDKPSNTGASQAQLVSKKEDCKITDAECLKKPIETTPAKKDVKKALVEGSSAKKDCKVTDAECLKPAIVVDKTKTAAGINEAIAKTEAEKDAKKDATLAEKVPQIKKLAVETPKKNDTATKSFADEAPKK